MPLKEVKNEALDELDLKIIEALKNNSRSKVSDIAKNLRKPRTTIMQRIKKLEERGVIRKYTVDVNPQSLGFNYYAYIMIKVRKGVGVKLDQIQLARKIVNETRSRNDLPLVEEASIVTGAYDIILRAWVRTWEELSKFLLKYLPSIEEVESTETFMVLQKEPQNT